MNNGPEVWTHEDVLQASIGQEGTFAKMWDLQQENAKLRMQLMAHMQVSLKAKAVIESNAAPGTVQELIEALNRVNI